MLVFVQFWIHLALVVIGIAYFLYSYIKERNLYQLLFVIWIPLTMLTYVSKNRVYLTILGIVQLLFFVLVIFFLFRRPRRKDSGYQSVIDQLDSYGAQEASQSEADGPAAEEPGEQPRKNRTAAKTLENNMKIVILDGHTLNPGDLSFEPLKEMGSVTCYDRTPSQLTAERIGDAEIVFTNKTLIDRNILDACPNIRYIGLFSTGYNVVDIKYAAERGITVTNVPAYSTGAVAQHVFALVLAFTNKVAEHDRRVQEGEWTSSRDFCFYDRLTELEGKTMGVVGYGRIGRQGRKNCECFWHVRSGKHQDSKAGAGRGRYSVCGF